MASDQNGMEGFHYSNNYEGCISVECLTLGNVITGGFSEVNIKARPIWV